jgi:uncharacterized protein YndB with AHSA1/START domain
VKLRESITIAAPAEQVWPYIVDPVKWSAWNQKLIWMRRARTGPVIPGEQLSTKWRLKRREDINEITVRLVEPMKKMVLRHSFQHRNRTRMLEITFSLEEKNSKTKLTQIVDHAEAGIPLVFQALIWFIHRSGKSVQMSGLEKLKTLVEAPP